MPFDVSRSGRCIVLDNLPPVVRLSWSDGTLTLAPEPPASVSPPEKSWGERIQELEEDRKDLEAGIAYRDSRIQEKDARIQSLHDELQALTAKHESLVEAHRDLTARDNDLIPSTPDEAPTVRPVVGHRFRMRDGKAVEVVSRDSDEGYPFNGSNGISWNRTGEEFSSSSSDGDLVEDLGPVDPLDLPLRPGRYECRDGSIYRVISVDAARPIYVAKGLPASDPPDSKDTRSWSEDGRWVPGRTNPEDLVRRIGD